jgi:DNA-binding NarL/FixJ family response regulator
MQWWQLSPAVSLGCRLMWAGELERARELLEGECRSHDGAGREAKAGFVRCWLSELEWRAGAWRRADTLAQEATERLGDVNPTAFPRALLAACTGRAEEASAIAEGALAWAAANDERVAPPRFHWLLGLLELSRGDAARAHASLAEAHARLDAAGVHEPGYLPLLPDLIESLVTLGRLDEADAMLARLEALAAQLDHRWATPASQRSRAQLLLARRNAAEAAALAGAAADQFAAIGHPLDRGRALLLGGNAQRRLGQRRQATQPLTEATQIFAQLGAPLWLQQAEDELQRANPRHRDRGRLTAAETRVATLVAAGRKNKEVAAELYTTVATVEAHLTRIYRKLGIRSRSELARHVADETVFPDQQ